MTEPVIELTKALISKKSISPDDNGCQDLLIDILKPFGFTIETLTYNQTKNLWAFHGEGETIMFAGHTDVVPSGDESVWQYPPFKATIDKDGFIFGRGASDMKSGVAAMVIAAKEFIEVNPNHKGRIAFLITSDEEAAATDGTVKVVEELQKRAESIDYCIVGEPTSTASVGDIIKNGRRGSVTANLIVHGVQGHVAYPHLVVNPVHHFAPALTELVSHIWDEGNEYFPPTSMQVANINGGTGAENVTPNDLSVQINFRFSSELTADDIKQKMQAILDKHQLKYTLNWRLSGNPFLTKQGKFTDIVANAIKKTTNTQSELSTSGGTSDGRFIAQICNQVIELGVTNKTIHKVNENVHCDEIISLKQIYLQVLNDLLGAK